MSDKIKHKLTEEQDKVWVYAFEFYLQDHTPKDADKLAFVDLVKECPELEGVGVIE